MNGKKDWERQRNDKQRKRKRGREESRKREKEKVKESETTIKFGRFKQRPLHTQHYMKRYIMTQKLTTHRDTEYLKILIV